MKTKINLKNYFNLIPYRYNLHKLRKNQWRSPSELEKLQFDKLKALLHHAYYKVDYYHKLFERAGISPEDIKNIQDLTKIPITSRKEIQALPKEKVIAKNVNLADCLNLRTSGSTGMPLDIFIGAREVMFRYLFYRRMYFENGGTLADRQLRITSPQNFKAKRWYQYIAILREKYISIFDDIESQLKIILEFKPNIIGGFASSLRNLAIKIKKQKIRGITPRIIFSTAELISKQDRELVNSAFRSELIDYYASNECGIIAWECREHSGYHIDSENVIVEFIKDDGTQANPEEEGEIVITSLNSFTMPFIRYKLGDIGIPSDEKCPCSRTFPLIKKITGRSNDYFVLPNNRKVHPFSLMRILRDIPGISRYQMIQQRKDKVIINIVKTDNFSSNTISKIKENSRNILGDNIEITVHIVDEISYGKTDKFQAIKSELNQHI